MNLSELQNLTPLAIVAIFAIREFFLYLRTKKTCENNKTYQGNGLWQKDIALMNSKLDNHLTGVENDIKIIYREIVDIKGDVKIIKNDIHKILITFEK